MFQGYLVLNPIVTTSDCWCKSTGGIESIDAKKKNPSNWIPLLISQCELNISKGREIKVPK